MSSQKSKNNSRDPKVSTGLKNKKSKNKKPDSLSNTESKPQIKFKKVKKISRSIRKIESEISNMQSKLQNIEKDLNSILKFIDNGKKS